VGVDLANDRYVMVITFSMSLIPAPAPNVMK